MQIHISPNVYSIIKMAMRKNIGRMHKELFGKIGDELPINSANFKSFMRNIALTERDKAENSGSAEDLLTVWETRGGVSPGNYNQLLQLLRDTRLINVWRIAKEHIRRYPVDIDNGKSASRADYPPNDDSLLSNDDPPKVAASPSQKISWADTSVLQSRKRKHIEPPAVGPQLTVGQHSGSAPSTSGDQNPTLATSLSTPERRECGSVCPESPGSISSTDTQSDRASVICMDDLTEPTISSGELPNFPRPLPAHLRSPKPKQVGLKVTQEDVLQMQYQVLQSQLNQQEELFKQKMEKIELQKQLLERQLLKFEF